MPELILRSGKRAGRRIPLPENDASIVFGRESGCQFQLKSDDVSRQHCRLRCQADGVVVTDLGSRNGTFVNERRLTSSKTLEAGDLLRVGPFLFQVPGGGDDHQLEDHITDWLAMDGETGAFPANDQNDTALVPRIRESDEDQLADENVPESETPTAMASGTQREDSVNRNDPVIQQAGEIIQSAWASKMSR